LEIATWKLQRHIWVIEMRLDKELVSEFKDLVSQEGYDALERWKNSVNPFVKGMDRAKKAILLSLASLPDGARRHRIHVLLIGPPATAKSDLRTWIKEQYGAYGISPESSEVGLLGDASSGEIQPGVLARAHNDVLTIDEIEKFSLPELDALLQSAEEGYYEVTKRNLNETFRSECRVIACCNKTDRLPNPLLDRFDYKIEISTPTKKEEKGITDFIYDKWFSDRDRVEAHKLRKYIEWASFTEPTISDEVMERIKAVKNFYIDMGESEVNIREKEALLRSVITIARLNCRDVVAEDYVKALELMHPEICENGSLRGSLYAVARGTELSEEGG